MAEASKVTSGQQMALAGVASTQLVTLLLYVVHELGLDNMPPEVAAAIVGIATAVAGAIQHYISERNRPHTERVTDSKDIPNVPV